MACLALCLSAAATMGQESLTGYTGTVTIQGSITGSADTEVRAYVNGLMVESVRSDVTGTYTIRFDIDGSLDQTVAVWFIPDSEDMVPELVVVKESSAARGNQIWSPCLPRLKPGPSLIHDLKFKSEADFLKAMEEAECFEEGLTG
jgi:hypothetical protein